MFLGFDFHRDDSIKDLDERLLRINQFLADKKSLDSSHRRFGIFLLTPNQKLSTINNLAKRQSKSHYRLCIEFFKNGNEYIPELELKYNLGKTPDLYNSMKKDVEFVSFLCAYPEQGKVTFKKSEHSISILFQFSDDDHLAAIIRKHLKVLLEEEEK